MTVIHRRFKLLGQLVSTTITDKLMTVRNITANKLDTTPMYKSEHLWLLILVFLYLDGGQNDPPYLYSDDER